ncbi:Os01g0147200 [Oryza sativa Japonica Group]|uniref:Os01g0147200 protein n=1 Tax=Oryza sativa subsp. japonica TaxID=39947 RepID=A0A0P0UYI5_ORYSJ|nr:Os01g0147200 [Oryza sativa Japonica Group]
MDDPYIDEDGEPLMDPYDTRDPSPEPQQQPYDDLEDDLGDDWNRGRSPTPVHGDDGAGSSSKPRKRLLKKGGGGGGGGGGHGMPSDGLDDWGEEAAGLADDDVDPEADAAKKRKGSSALRDLARGGGKEKKEKKRRKEDGREREGGRGMGMAREKRGGSGGKGFGGGGGGGHGDQDEGEREIQELWDTIAGGDSEVIIDHVLLNLIMLALFQCISDVCYGVLTISCVFAARNLSLQLC